MLTPPDFNASAFSDFWPALNSQLALLKQPEADFGEARDARRIGLSLFHVIETAHVAAFAAGLVLRRTRLASEANEDHEAEVETPDFTLTIQTGNSAFEGRRREEIARILIDLGERLRNSNISEAGRLRDFNCNTVGTHEGMDV